MSPSADANSSRTPAEVLGFRPGQLVQEFGYDDDVDLDLRDAMEDMIDGDLEYEDSQEIVDAVVVWWRKDDGDLTDALVDAIGSLASGGPIWLLAPKPGREGTINPADIQDAADTAGLRVMTTASLAPEWLGTRLATRAG